MLLKGLEQKDDGSLAVNVFKFGNVLFHRQNFRNIFEVYGALEQREERELNAWIAANVEEKTTAYAMAQKITKEEVSKVTILPDFPKFGPDLIRLIKLYRHYCTRINQSLEVSALFFYDPKQHCIRILVPSQIITPAHVNWDLNKTNDKLVCISSGIEFTVASAEKLGFIYIGTTHSHNTLGCTWSGDSEGADKHEICGSFYEARPAGINLLVYNFKNPSRDDYSFNYLWSANSNGDWCHLAHDVGTFAPPDVSSIVDVELLSQLDLDTLDYHENVNKVIKLWSPPAVPKPTSVPKYNWLPAAKQPAKTFVIPAKPGQTKTRAKRADKLTESRIVNIEAIQHHVQSLDLKTAMEHVAEFISDVSLYVPNVTYRSILEALIDASDVIDEAIIDYVEDWVPDQVFDEDDFDANIAFPASMESSDMTTRFEFEDK